jgi:DNA-binding SARP family transcriptional activator/predicted ATPase
MSRLALYLLGPPRLELDGEPVHIAWRKAVALLAYLAVTGQSHSRDTLATLLWPEYDQSRARANLRRALSLLNRTLGGEWLTADRETAGLNPDADLWLDMDQFRQHLSACETRGHRAMEICPQCAPLLEEAVELYRDHFLTGFTLRDSGPFDEFQFFQTEGLKDQLAGVLVRLASYHTSQGEYEPAIGYARRWLVLDPLHEPAHRHLMALYAHAGQRAAALRQYQLCEQTLLEELGLPPSEETQTLYDRIRSGAGIEPVRPPHNLPPQLTPFVGREGELVDLDQLIGDPDVRLITIVGPGGIGKTRLALATAERQLDTTRTTAAGPEPRFPNGVFFVPLAPLISVDQIVPAVARATRFSFHEEREPRQQVLDYLREKRLLLLVDNLEHVPEGVDLLAEILQTAPAVHILATSRERLHLHQEQVYPIQGLPYPDWETGAEAPAEADLTAYDAVKLFLHSAQRVQPHFELTDDDLVHVTRLCHLVDGMPLGIELAAAWVDMLSLADIAAETQHSLDFLAADWRDIPARHRSVRAAFDASWAWLGQAERDVFPQLSVFRGGFTRQAAQEVADASLPELAALAEKSLLQYDQSRDRYRIHELLRQYGADRLGTDPDREAVVSDRHSAYYCAWLQQRAVDLKGPRQQAALAEIEADVENTQAAWGWAVSERWVAGIDQAMDGLCGFFELRHRYQDGETTSGMAAAELSLGKLPEDELTLADRQRALAKALAWQARFSHALGRLEVANALLNQCRALLEGPALADQDTRAIQANQALAVMPHIHVSGFWPDLEEIRRHCEHGLALYRALGDEWGVADALAELGFAARLSGAYDEAKQLYEESLASYRALGNQWRVAHALNGLGWVARGLGAYDETRELWEESLALSRAQNNLWGSADSLRYLSYLALFQGRFDDAARRLRQSIALCQESGDRLGRADDLCQLSVAHCLSGQFIRAHAVSEEAVAILQDLGHPFALAMATAFQARVNLHMGQYQEARAQANMANTLARGVHGALESGLASGGLGSADAGLGGAG